MTSFRVTLRCAAPWLLCVLASCSRDQASAGQAGTSPPEPSGDTHASIVEPLDAHDAPDAKNPPVAEVLGEARVDFGAVEFTREPLTHTFTVANTLDETLTIANVRRSCGCLSVLVDPEVIPPSGTSEITVGMDVGSFAGERKTSVLLEFDRPDAPPVYLELRARAESDYQVNIAPLLWTVKRNQNGPTRVERRFQLTELISRGIEQDEIAEGPTAVRSESKYLEVVEASEFRPIGWRRTGFAREGEVLLALELPADAPLDDIEAGLLFEHRPVASGAESANETQSALVSVRVRSR